MWKISMATRERMDADGARSGPRLELAELVPVDGQHQMGGRGKVAVQGAEGNVGLRGNLGEGYGLEAFTRKPGSHLEDAV
jgi:hypothetical protein